MTSNEYIGLSHVQKKTVNGKETKGWITVGVIASKTETKRSAVCRLQIRNPYLAYTVLFLMSRVLDIGKKDEIF